MRTFIKPRQTKKFISGTIAGLFVALQFPLALLASPLVSATAPANGGNIACPAGTTLLAKYNFNGSTYVADSGADTVTVTGTSAQGTFTVNAANTVVSAVVVKGGTDAKTTSYSPAVTTGTFDNTGLVNGGNQTPAISNVKICGNTQETPPVVTTTVVVPETIQQSNVCSTNNDTFTIPTTTGVDYQIDGVTVPAGTHHTGGVLSITVTAVAQSGYSFAANTQTTQTLTFTNVACPPNDEDNTRVTLCHATGSTSNPYEQITVAAAGGASGHYGDHENDIIPAFDYNGTHYAAQNFNTTNQTIYNNDCEVPEGNPVETTTVTPVVISTHDQCGTANDTYTIPSTTGVTYQVNGEAVAAGTHYATSNVTVTAVAQEGYMFAEGNNTSQRLTFTNTPCNSERVTLCHATGSATNPYVQLEVDAAGAYNGHYSQHDGDIIPTFTYNGHTYSQNYNAAGQATYNNNCMPEHVGLGGGGGGSDVTPVSIVTPTPTPAATTVLSIMTPQKTVAQNNSVGFGGGQLVNTGSTMLLNLFAGMFLIGTAATLTVASRRRSA